MGGSLGAQEDSLTGKELFTRRWQVRDQLCKTGDGLGPCFNAASCVECHNQGVIGGGGDNSHNVDLLTALSSPAELREAQRSREPSAFELHPEFLTGSATIVLHRFGANSDYEAFRFQSLGVKYSREMNASERARFWADVARDERKSQPVEALAAHKCRFQLSHRSTPALFGAGLIDTITDEQVRAIEKRQTEGASRVSGRVAPALRSDHTESVGRFGWRGQMATLTDFVLGACANELGLQSGSHKQAIDPSIRTNVNWGVDLDADACEDMVRFVRDLPCPVRVMPLDAQDQRTVERGESLFHRIGCADCHVKDIGDVEELYSDLLLHDLGHELSDPAPAMPKTVIVGQRIMRAGYFGGVMELNVLAEVPSEIQQEWRTPPLWGVASSAPYLHDGRATDLVQAIRFHGGEAAQSRQQFANLSVKDRDCVTAFLLTMRAPVLK